MEESISKIIESIRRKIEEYEENGFNISQEEEGKKILNNLNNIKVKIYKEKMFSDNEEFKDVKTEDIKFMLVAYYQSEMIQKFQSNRKNILNFAIKFYKEFFTLLKSYNYLSKAQIQHFNNLTKEKTDEEKNKKQDFNQMQIERTQKIEMYRYKKSLSEKLKRIENEKTYDDNREYWQDYLNLCIVKMFENIRMVLLEIDSINYIEKMRKEKGEVPKAHIKKEDEKQKKGKMEVLRINNPEDLLKLDPNNKLVQNLNFVTSVANPNCQECFQLVNGVQTLDDKILAQLPENMRRNVFKNSNPTEMTMEEFAEIQMKHMHEAQQKQEEYQKNKSDSDSDKEEVSNKKTKKARDWDDWKDDHPKGSGNRMGK